MGLFSKLFRHGSAAEKPTGPDRVDAADDEELVLGGGTESVPTGPAEKRGAEKRRHPRVVQTTAGGAYGKPRYWVYGGGDCYEDPHDDSATLSLDEAREKAAMSRPDLDGKVELPRYLKERGDK
ncbi:MAG: hypothetical protein ABI790_01770 [Betaproteobacteria bacterium]